MFIFHGSTAFVTAASKGLGAAYAEALARRGVNRVLIAHFCDAVQAIGDHLAGT